MAANTFLEAHKLRIANHMSSEVTLWDMRKTMFASGTCTSAALFATNYIDTLNTRYGALAAPQKKQLSLVEFGRNVVKKEGVVRGLLLPGAAPQMAVGLVSAAVRIGCYPFIRDQFIQKGEKKSVRHMAASGMVGGAIGFGIATPFLRVKGMMQTSLNNGGVTKSMTRHLKEIFSKEGVAGLFKGNQVIMIRGALMNTSQQVGYDFTKTTILRHGIFGRRVADAPKLHYFAAFVASLSANTCCLPVDTILGRFAADFGAERFRMVNVIESAIRVYQERGLSMFYRGWSMAYVKFGPLFFLAMPTYEQSRRLMGIPYNT